jgi:ketosteroid isomerase-like protein
VTELQEFLDEFIPRQEAADFALHQGDPEPRKRLWSRQDPVTLLGAKGVMASGWDQVNKTFDWVAASFSDCEEFRLEVIAAGVSGDIAYTVALEHSRLSRSGGPVQDYRLRVTHAYRREGGEWRIVHRHGDELAVDEVD